MRILVCPDSFKGSLSALEAARAMARGARRALPNACVDLSPLADGGEGTMDALPGRKVSLTVPGPLGRPVRAAILLLPRRTAVVETASAAGLLQVPSGLRDPMRTTTFGVGRLIAAAVRRGARRVVVTLGGSATVDAGLGMAVALGARLLDSSGRPVPPGGRGLLALASADVRPVRKALAGATVVGASDVFSPLLGPRGARLYMPQKGATPRQVALLEKGLARFARIAARDLKVRVARLPGAGSAGGLGAGLAAFTRARLVSGADLVFELTGFGRRLARADLVLTGEGRLDAGTAMGKLVARVARRAARRRVPVLAFAGQVDLSPRATRRMGLSGAFHLAPPGTPATESVRRAGPLLERAVEKALRGWFGT
jgi:glycerate kinase